MTEQFENIVDLIKRYYEKKSSPLKPGEELFSFIVETNKFLFTLSPIERYIFDKHNEDKKASFESIARSFVERGRKEEKRYWKQHVIKETYNSVLAGAEGHFLAMRYLKKRKY